MASKLTRQNSIYFMFDKFKADKQGYMTSNFTMLSS